MNIINLNELRDEVALAKESLELAAERCDRNVKVYLHWSAGHYGQFYDDYHINIDKDGTMYMSHPLDVTLAHTWKRNTGSIGLSMACCAFATSGDLGDEPPTSAQIESMAQAIAVICKGLDIPITKDFVLTHGEAADNEDNIYPHEPYGCKNGCERWDLEYLGTDESPEFNPWATDGSRGGDVLRGKANWYLNRLI